MSLLFLVTCNGYVSLFLGASHGRQKDHTGKNEAGIAEGFSPAV
jgi:hypothetical protein